MKSKVYFIKEVTPDALVKIYEAMGKKLNGNIAIKLHSGEKGNQNYVKPEFVQKLIDKLGGTVVECNTAYEGARNTTEKHKKLMEEHNWTKYFNVDILDSEGPDKVLPVKGGVILKENYVGKNIDKYDSCLVLSHFKGHPMGGYGGALKQLSIGFASSKGKNFIHNVGKFGSFEDMFNVKQEDFLTCMADSAKSICDYFKDNICYINIMCNMSVDCDCCYIAEDPCMKDIGILASLDPVAIDKACIDLVKKSDDPGKEHFLERVTSKNGEYTIEVAEKIGIGQTDYELIEI